MAFLHDEDDFEPLDDDERCLAAYGPYHIGREDETRADVALLFDTRWFSQHDPAQAVIEVMLAATAGLSVRFMAWGSHAFRGSSADQLYAALWDELCAARPYDRVMARRLFVVTVDLQPETTQELNKRLADHPGYVGYAGISWPNQLRSLLADALIPAWELASASADEQTHWVHHLPR